MCLLPNKLQPGFLFSALHGGGEKKKNRQQQKKNASSQVIGLSKYLVKNQVDEFRELDTRFASPVKRTIIIYLFIYLNKGNPLRNAE